jgi:CHAP domain
LAVFTIAGISLAGCQSVRPQFSASFTGGDSTRFETHPELTLTMTVSSAEPVITEEGGTGLALIPRHTSLPAETSLSEERRLLPSDINPRILDSGSKLECVPFARAESGIEIRGNANRWWQLAAGKYQRTKRPQAGSVFVMRGYRTARRGHVAVVKKILDSRTIVVDHSNWGNDGRIYLEAPIRDLSPKNDWSRVQVWYTPSNQWGRRVYKAKGFILPSSTVAGGPSDNAIRLITGTN